MSESFSLIPPTWLNQEFFSGLVSDEFPGSEIIGFEVEPANKRGENYSSVMFRVRIEVKEKHTEVSTKKSYIAKLDPLGMTQNMMDKFIVFPKEMQVYNELIPKFQKIYKRSSEEDVQFAPQCLRASCGRSGNLIILEDLCEKGFKTANRRKGLDRKHAELALSALAKFHAASAVYFQEEKDNISDLFSYGLYADHMKPTMYPIYLKNVDLMKEISSTWSFGGSMSRFLDNIKEKMLDRVFELVKTYRKGDRFQVLCHGDFWCNNVLFRYDKEEDPVDCLLVDFQLSNFNSPAFDLNYFIFTSVSSEIKLSHMDHLIHHYHTQLQANLEQLGYPGQIPSLCDLHRDFHDLGAFGLSSTYGTLCVVVAPPGVDANFKNFTGDDEESKEVRRVLFSNPVYKEALGQLIPYFERKGVF